jgi:hypothetical protein
MNRREREKIAGELIKVAKSLVAIDDTERDYAYLGRMYHDINQFLMPESFAYGKGDRLFEGPSIDNHFKEMIKIWKRLPKKPVWLTYRDIREFNKRIKEFKRNRNANEGLSGGLADGRTPDEFPKDALQEGLKVEREHTDDPNLAIEIVMDHLTEDPDYYVKLREIEGQ